MILSSMLMSQLPTALCSNSSAMCDVVRYHRRQMTHVSYICDDERRCLSRTPRHADRSCRADNRLRTLIIYCLDMLLEIRRPFRSLSCGDVLIAHLYISDNSVLSLNLSCINNKLLVDEFIVMFA